MPLVMPPALLLTRPPGEAIEHWLTDTLLWARGGGCRAGLVGRQDAGLGYAQPFSERVSGLTASVALALATVAWVHLIGRSGILAAFVAGLMFQRFLQRVEDPRAEHVQAAIGRFFDLPVFVLFGLSAPWRDWLALEWTAWAFLAAVLLLRRPPVWLLLQPLLPSLRDRREAFFNGWFGPIGIAALFYAAEASQITNLDQVWTIGSLVVFGSILVHGISATPLIRRYGRLIALRRSPERTPERVGLSG
jgi:sodium/hydrogen antiporter